MDWLAAKQLRVFRTGLSQPSETGSRAPEMMTMLRSRNAAVDVTA